MTTGEILVLRRTALNRLMSSLERGLAIQPRGLREKICTVSQPSSADLINALCRPPIMGAWKPNFGRLCLRIWVAIPLGYSSRATTAALPPHSAERLRLSERSITKLARLRLARIGG